MVHFIDFLYKGEETKLAYFLVNDTIIYFHVCTFKAIVSSVLAYEVIHYQLN